MITQKQIKFVYVLLNQIGASDVKADIVYSFSNQRTTSLSELKSDEAKELIDHLMKEAKLPESSASKMKNKMFWMAHEMHWELEDGRVDMERLNNWCIKYGREHKTLDEYRNNELPLLVSQFTQTYNDFIKGI